MKYTIEKTEKYSLVQLHEEKLTSATAPELKSELVKLNAEGSKNIILDMNDVKYVDSSGLSSILVGNRLCDNEQGMFVLTGISDHVMKLIKISHLDNILNLIPTVEESVDAIFMNELEKNLRAENKEE
ncbi:MAG: STAS domain-containing protein [Sporocytophaga sp.]|uniref:Anti-sigma factor antagonist n=1 Tax=Sporocytophaga myxococcoides TaxID=153721 RepID=A0A098LL21_9BACT|nr:MULTISPECIES: STAS domain-containing protein [Sporocytophaga]MBO9703582.1 STAS domain-containing protein [Sporocytophaga sp.]GAL87685.1 anti-anti-sigma regulatory factor [Sporocytophaga myxococcoides]